MRVQTAHSASIGDFSVDSSASKYRDGARGRQAAAGADGIAGVRFMRLRRADAVWCVVEAVDIAVDVGDHDMHGHDTVHAFPGCPRVSMRAMALLMPADASLTCCCTVAASVLLSWMLQRIACLSASCMPCWHLPALQPTYSLDCNPLSQCSLPKLIAD